MQILHFLLTFCILVQKCKKCISEPKIVILPFWGSKMTKIPLRLPSFLQGAAKSQNFTHFNHFTQNSHFLLQNANLALFTPRCSLGPSGLTYDAKSPYTSQESEGGFLNIFAGNGNIVKLHFCIVLYFSESNLQVFSLQKNMSPPLRTKPYYSKPKWSPRRPK